MEPYIILGIIILLLAFTAWQIYSFEKRVKARNEARIRKEWGAVPSRTYSADEMASIASAFEKKRTGGLRRRDRFYIDDITWNDLDMDNIFALLNNTQSSAGDEYVYRALRSPCFEPEELKERNALAEYFAQNEDVRFRMQMKLASIGRTKKYSMTDYIDTFMTLHAESNSVHYIPLIFLCIAVAMIPFHLAGILAAIMILAYNVATYYKTKGKIEPYFACVTYIVQLVKQSEGLCREFKNVPELEPYLRELKQASADMHSIVKAASLIGTSSGVSDNPGEIVFEYLKILTHIDLIQFNRILNKVQVSTAQIETMTETIGRMELSIAIASFRALLPVHALPELVGAYDLDGALSNARSGEHMIEAQNLYHPLIREPVANSIKEHKPVLLTGSNASGKSTFLKTLAINAILAQSIDTVTATAYRANYYRIFSSMALRDDLEGEESYYMVEIKSLKRIVAAAKEDGMPVLCFVDEVLRGTNTVERIAASSQILKTLARDNVMCFAATHDIELTHMLTEYYHNYHFREEIVENDVKFNYILYQGRSTTRNAIKLLEIIGYEKKITTAAEQAAQHFMQTGVWEVQS